MQGYPSLPVNQGSFEPLVQNGAVIKVTMENKNWVPIYVTIRITITVGSFVLLSRLV